MSAPHDDAPPPADGLGGREGADPSGAPRPAAPPRTGASRARRNPRHATALRPRQRLGKFRIVRRITSGGFAEVYEAEDTIEGIRVALRIPRPDIVDDDLLKAFRKEVRLVARLEHPNVLPVKSADFIDGRFVITTLLGEGTLLDALKRRATVATLLDYTLQLLEAVAHAHEHRVIHCDIKPENLILFPGGKLRLTDFGIAKAVIGTIAASGSGTVGYLAPEQALGRPSVRSDVFSIGLVVWEMLTGVVPEWPFEWPPPALEQVRRKVHPDLIAWLRRSLHVDQKARHRDAARMLAAFRRLKSAGRLLPRNETRKKRKKSATEDWRVLRRKLFLRRHRKTLALTHRCPRCDGEMTEAMRGCPWCGHAPRRYGGPVHMPARCPRCARGRKLDWRFCAWCYGAGMRSVATRPYRDKRYSARCSNPRCQRKELMPFMQYCPWCRSKVKRRWTFEGADARCRGCGWGVVREFWDWCPWCTTKIRKKG